jgi:hypothetical protein
MAGTIEIVSASAGSGKTYRLAEELERAVVQPPLRQDAHGWPQKGLPDFCWQAFYWDFQMERCA